MAVVREWPIPAGRIPTCPLIRAHRGIPARRALAPWTRAPCGDGRGARPVFRRPLGHSPLGPDRRHSKMPHSQSFVFVPRGTCARDCLGAQCVHVSTSVPRETCQQSFGKRTHGIAGHLQFREGYRKKRATASSSVPRETLLHPTGSSSVQPKCRLHSAIQF